ncbi:MULTISPECIES: Ni-sirohydrochlorin a,c-diamide synthase [Methanoculleus]|uniref:Cobyrinate a,c-diamide synthase n=2 Tax=Methanoculleus TaxID=45989 RepID=A3CWB1_METMJ|nr:MULTISPECIES: Ni-sirohydrochlorin a,c-diamide synthase [Methanoculleus]ABN57661.1 cobyrinate a,c-diamide synthase [Methanoculleus marisnigri JR1]UYU19057.1 Ni-sirohydrochlorin a,c-diamide synthase [Methanoculleus submarinus]
MKSFLVAGDRSGSGKTSITLALSALLSTDRAVQTFKVGMDYIDPSYLAGVTGRPCRNLDGYVMSQEEVRAVFAHGCRGADVAVVEGVRGLFEGAEALTDLGSTAAIAKQLDLPVVLVVNARSITRSAAAIVKGFLAFDPDVDIRGVILNNVTGTRHREKAVRAIEHYCGIPVVGVIPRTEEMELAMRHLGLVPYREGQEHGEFLTRIETVKRMIADHVDADALLALAREGEPPAVEGSVYAAADPDVRIGVALDEAFNFYYADLFDILASCGAETVPFSPIHDPLPEADGYVLGGGYPELFGAELEANTAMREGLREVSRNGTPIYAECGGLIYLTDRMVLAPGFMDAGEERSYDLAGVFAGETRMPARRMLGYVVGTSAAGSPMGEAAFRGHEFHYSSVDLAPETRFAYRLSRGSGIRGGFDGAVRDRTIGSYTHLHPVASRGMLAHFTDCCRG